MIANRPNILENLSRAEVIGDQRTGGFQVFGIQWPCGNGDDYATLDEALGKKLIDVTEIDEGGQVSTLKVSNNSERMVFLMAGEELVGGKQNRVLNASMMVQPKMSMPVPVTCVERGRWGYKSAKFGSGQTTSHSSLRRMMSKQVSDSYRVSATPRSDQGAVWKEVARKMVRMGSKSSSDSLHDFFADYANRLGALLGGCKLPQGANGAVFAINGKIVGADLFDRPATLLKLWVKVSRGYAADVLEEPKENPPSAHTAQVAAWLKSAISAEQLWYDSPGIGQDVRIEGQNVVGAALVVNNHPIHVELFQEKA